MHVLIIRVLMWLAATAVSLYFTVVSYKQRWYAISGFDAGIATIELAIVIGIIVEYFTT